MRLCIFEDSAYENLYPLAHLRASFELKCGALWLYERLLRQFGLDSACFFGRDYLKPVVEKRLPGSYNDMSAVAGDDVLLVNGKVLALDLELELDGPEEIGVCEEQIVYARARKDTVAACGAADMATLLEALDAKLTKTSVDAKLISYPWHLIKYNIEAIIDDFRCAGKSGAEGDVSPQAAMLGDKSDIYVAPGAEVLPFAALDAREGPVTVERGAKINPGSWIIGPSVIGEDTYVMGASVREGCAFGKVCRVGGEVEETIMHEYVNKWHEGFLGHSYVCPFVNIGAGTFNSDVKNDFGNIDVYVKGDLVPTGEWKVGCYLGDHTKTSIGTLFNTGSHVGVMAIILGGDGVTPKFLPSFGWFINRKVTKGFGFNALIDAANGQMSKRDHTLSPEDIELLEVVRELTKPERDELIKKGRR